jgi:hypothetical protein
MAKKQDESKKAKLTLTYGTVLSVPPPSLAAGLGGFLSQPLPVLARLDLKVVCDAILKRSETLNEAKIELMKKHGASEKNGTLSIKYADPNYPAYEAEYQLLCNRTFELPLTDRVKLPAHLSYLGREVDLVMDGVAAAMLSDIIEVKR